MHITFVLLLAAISANACPSICQCSDTTVNCFGVGNVTDGPPSNITSLIIANATNSFLEDIFSSAHFEYLRNLTIKHCANCNFSVFDDFHQTFFNLTELENLDVSNNQISAIFELPILQSLRVLNFSGNVIKTVKLNGVILPELRSLDLSRNELQALNQDMFASLNKLQSLNLSNNNLETLNSTCFNSLPRLQSLDVSWNRLKHVNPDSLQLPNLSNLLLRGNVALGRTEPTLFIGPGGRLQLVDMSNTGLTQIPAALTHSIRALHLAKNSIREINCGALDAYPLLKIFDLTSNDVELIEDDALGRSDLLTRLYLSRNKLRSVPRNFPEKLAVLHLDGNAIETLHKTDFVNLERLKVLLLNDNKIETVENGVFNLKALAVLDLSRNPIATLPGTIFTETGNLQKLRLANLNFYPTNDEIPSFPEQLITLDLSDSSKLVNRIMKAPEAFIAAKNLEKLNLSKNKLNNIRSDLVRFLPKLQILYLYDNPIDCSSVQFSIKNRIRIQTLCTCDNVEKINEQSKMVASKQKSHFKEVLLVSIPSALMLFGAMVIFLYSKSCAARRLRKKNPETASLSHVTDLW